MTLSQPAVVVGVDLIIWNLVIVEIFCIPVAGMGSSWNAHFPNTTVNIYLGRISNPSTHRYTSRLHYAAHDGDCERIIILVEEGYDLELKDQYGRTPLLRAALKGHVDAFDLLLRCGADFQARDDWGRYSEHLAAKENHLELFEFIMQLAGPEVLNSKDNFGRTPIHLASLKGGFDAIHSIVSTDYNINSTDNWKRTALHLARKEGHREIGKFLEERGANNQCEDVFGKTPNAME